MTWLNASFVEIDFLCKSGWVVDEEAVANECRCRNCLEGMNWLFVFYMVEIGVEDI